MATKLKTKRERQPAWWLTSPSAPLTKDDVLEELEGVLSLPHVNSYIKRGATKEEDIIEFETEYNGAAQKWRLNVSQVLPKRIRRKK